MNYSNVISELNQASSFDLFRLNVAINNELESPKRILAIKQKLYIGMQLSYFDYVENRLIPATLVNLKQKNAVVLDQEKNKRFIIPYYMLNVDGASTDIDAASSKEKLSINNLKVGDSVSFNHQGKFIAGKIKRLNHKTVTLETKDNGQWRVSYACLSRVHDATPERQAISSKEIVL